MNSSVPVQRLSAPGSKRIGCVETVMHGAGGERSVRTDHGTDSQHSPEPSFQHSPEPSLSGLFLNVAIASVRRTQKTAPSGCEKAAQEKAAQSTEYFCVKQPILLFNARLTL